MEQLSFTQNLARTFPVVSGGVGMEQPLGSPYTTFGPDKKSETTGEKPVVGNVTEIILPEGQVENFQLLLPMLTQLNREKRWLAWIDPPQALVSKWQGMHGIVANEILVLRSSSGYTAQDLAERALGAGTCHAVVMWTSKLARGALQALQTASAKGNSHGVVLRQR